METTKINDVCKTLKTTSRTLRYYEEVGLIKGIKVNKWREYKKIDVDKIKLILLFRQLDFSLSDIGKIFDKELSIENIQLLFNDKINYSRNQIQKYSVEIQLLNKFLETLTEKNNNEDISKTLLNDIYDDYVNVEINVLKKQENKRRNIVTIIMNAFMNNKIEEIRNYLCDFMDISILNKTFIDTHKIHEQTNFNYVMYSESSSYNDTIFVIFNSDSYELYLRFIFTKEDLVKGIWQDKFRKK